VTALYKATRANGTDFRTGRVDYAAALVSGEILRHPTSTKIVKNEASTYLSVSVEPAETLIGGAWPCRLFRVEADGKIMDDLSASQHKRAVLGMRVVEELPAHLALGPNGEEVAALIARTRLLTYEEAQKMGAAWDAAWDAAWGAVRDAAWDAAWGAVRGAARDAARGAAWDAAWGAAWGAAWDAALSTMVKDLITPEQYELLMAPWWAGVGK
jgi:hypothetical protein